MRSSFIQQRSGTKQYFTNSLWSQGGSPPLKKKNNLKKQQTEHIHRQQETQIRWLFYRQGKLEVHFHSCLISYVILPLPF